MRKRCQKWCACLMMIALTVGYICTSFANVQAEGNGFQDILIVVDAGHTTNYNPGCIEGYNEGDWAYRQMMLDAEAYRAAGFTVITTREPNTNPGLVARGQMAVQNAAGYKDVVFISNHTNATPDLSTKASGVTAITSQYLSQKNMDLTNALMEATAYVMNSGTGNTYVRPATTRLLDTGADWYGVIRGAVNGATSKEQAAQGPVQYALILEHGFHTNPAECAFLMDETNCRLMAEGKAIALTKYFGDLHGIPYTAKALPTVPQPEIPAETTPAETVPTQTVPVETPVETTPTQTVAPSYDYSDIDVIVKPEDGYNYWSGEVVVEDDGLNVRREANSFVDNVVGKLPNGTTVIVTGEAVSGYGDVWFSIVADDIRGFVNARYVLPKYYEAKEILPTRQNTTVYSLPSADSKALPVYPTISYSDKVVVLNEIKQEDCWWSIIKINDKCIGFIPNTSVAEK